MLAKTFKGFAGAAMTSVLILGISNPAFSKTRNEYMTEVVSGCSANASSCGALIEAAMAEIIEAGGSFGSIAGFVGRLTKQATKAAVKAGGSVEAIGSIAVAATNSVEAVKEAAGDANITTGLNSAVMGIAASTASAMNSLAEAGTITPAQAATATATAISAAAAAAPTKAAAKTLSSVASAAASGSVSMSSVSSAASGAASAVESAAAPSGGSPTQAASPG